MEEIQCISCKKRITNDAGAVNFPCPNCGEEEIIRCSGCRKLAVRYKCTKCEFEGPN